MGENTTEQAKRAFEQWAVNRYHLGTITRTGEYCSLTTARVYEAFLAGWSFRGSWQSESK